MSLERGFYAFCNDDLIEVVQRLAFSLGYKWGERAGRNTEIIELETEGEWTFFFFWPDDKLFEAYSECEPGYPIYHLPRDFAEVLSGLKDELKIGEHTVEFNDEDRYIRVGCTVVSYDIVDRIAKRIKDINHGEVTEDDD